VSYLANRFLEANKRSPVVYGSVLDVPRGGRGCFYRLEDGKTFELTADDCRAVGFPRWAFELEAALTDRKTLCSDDRCKNLAPHVQGEQGCVFARATPRSKRV
jgi:hypothetical protein